MPKKVLVVDDIKTNRLILTEILKRDYSILEAASGEAALEVLDREQDAIAAVLLDISMPGIDGFEVLRRIRDDTRLSQIPVIMITGSEGEKSRVMSLSQGANDYVTKPYNAEVIRHCLRNHIAFREAAVTVFALQRDKLTGLYTRDTFFEKAAEMIAAEPPGYFYLACLDIDNFKVINDQYGAEMGNEVIVVMANRLRASCNTQGGICGRIAADNFIGLYPAELTTVGKVNPVYIEEAVREKTGLEVTMSAGRYLVDDKALTVAAMYDRAKLAQRTVKGRFDTHIAVYDESMRARMIKEQEIVTDMKPALAARQFEPWFQPQYNHATGAMIGAEALVRWRHPQRGLIPPYQFIPLFEQNGFIYELDKYVWEEVCRYLRKWLDEGRNPLPVSVNISRQDVLRADLIDVLTGLIDQYRLPVDLLRLEVTESAFAKDSAAIIAAVQKLLDCGFTVEIDDFGSGYSSLNTLKDVPAQILKLDMKFLESGNDTQRGGNIVESVVRMAKWLGMSVIAEGVETLEQADYLRSIGCNYIQGYLYAKPMPAADYEAHCKGLRKEEHLLTLETVENLDNNALWDPSSLDSLIFNGYIGAACIFEVSGERVELIRATELFAKLFNPETTVDAVLKINWAAYLDAGSRAKVEAVFGESGAKEKPVTEELLFIDLPKCPPKTYIRATLRVIATAGSRQLVYCTADNVTAQREAEQEILESDEQLRFLNDMSHDLLAQPDTGTAIETVLNKLIDYFQGDRAYIFECNAATETISNTYEVCKDGVTPQIENLREIPYAVIAPWIHAFEQRGYIAIESIEALDDDRAAERSILIGQGISSLAAAPVQRDGRIIGFIGVDDPQRRVAQVARLAALGDYIAVMLTRRDLNARISSDKATMSNMMQDMPGGFARMRIHADGTGHTEYANEGFCKMLGMTLQEVLDTYSSDLMTGVHPDDKAEVEAALTRAIVQDGIMNAQYRLRAKNGEYVWMQIFARIVHADMGDLLIYCYYADMTESQKNALSLRGAMPFLLSAIMESSPNLDFAKDKDFNFICCSPAFVRFTRQKSEADVVGKNDYDFWTKEEADHFRHDDIRLFEGGESLIEYTEPIPSDDGIQHYSVTSKYILRDSTGEIIGLYGTGRDITNLRAVYDRLKLLTDSIPGGIASYAVSPDHIQTTYFNDGFCKMLGCTREEYEALLKDGATRRVFPEDLPALTAQIKAMYDHGAPIDCTYRNRKAHGDGYIWINMRAELSERSGDTCFVNAVLYDVTAQRETERRQNELLDNLPGGSALYEYDGEKLTVVHLNKRYWALVGRSETDCLSLHPLSAVHPDDRAATTEALLAAIAEGHDLACDLRLLYGSGDEYRSYHVDGHILPRGDGKYAIYASYTPVDPNVANYRQMLAHLLDTIMVSTNDYAFAKDKDFRYLCCSPAFLRLAGLPNEKAALGKTDFDLFPAAMAMQFRENDLALFEAGKAMVDFDETIRETDGSTRYCRASKYILTDARGAIIGLYGVSRDITDVKAMQSQLELMNDSLPGGLATYAFAEHSTRITYCNDGFCKLFGGTREGLMARGDIDHFDWVIEADRPIIRAQIDEMLRSGAPIDCTFRIRTLDGFVKWIDFKAVVVEKSGDKLLANALLLDTSNVQEMLEQLRMSEEESHLAVEHGGNLVCRYSVTERTLAISAEIAAKLSFPPVLYDVPDAPIREGLISPETAEAFRGFFEAIRRGEPSGSVLYQQRYERGWQWTEAKSSTIFSDDGKPMKAVISMFNVTDRIEKEAIYQKWQQSLDDRDPASYTLFRINLSHRGNYELKEGALLTFDFDGTEGNSTEVANAYTNQRVFGEDREKYRAFVNADTMLAEYYRGRRMDTLEYRELTHDSSYRWLRLTVELVQGANSEDVEAYLMYENINESKRAELETVKRSETDPLTGLLNRAAFSSKVDQILHMSAPDQRCALLMLDIDGFKRVNDVFGHGAGDQVLKDVASGLRGMVRANDLVSRLGGDEFMVFLSGIRDEAVARERAKQVCAIAHKSLSMEVQISGSVGIVYAPRDGLDFMTLYKKVDAALYYVKGSGKNNIAVYTDNMADQNLEPEADADGAAGESVEKKRRMLIVDDNSIQHELLRNIFKDDFIIEPAQDGNTALIRLRNYGNGISVVLLDLIMPGMDGFAVLAKMQESEELRAIPVIIVSGDERRETCLEAIRCGATDFITKPVDAELLRIRVRSAVSKSENERLRAKNRLLEAESRQKERYESYLDSPGITFAEYDRITGAFHYYPSIADRVGGSFDQRALWRVLSEDGVADEATASAIRALIEDVSGDQEPAEGGMIAPLKTPRGATHRFRIHARRPSDGSKGASRVVVSLTDLEAEKPF